eukprot:TRINITY_DN3974_c0_g2_i1.p1 TRINITY_DN3974_c0_g2~~TRINITY_DN3974_c0_g2_i1.p1  ORF type:complete len:308 (+),score=33.10 TRINITY_DN3974_c0_g2_i1:87-1010(+)
MENQGKLIKEFDAETNGVMSLCCGVENGEPVVYSGGMDGKIKVWDVNGELKGELKGHEDTVNTLTIVGDDLVSGGDDALVIRWNLKNREPKYQLTARGAVNKVVLANSDSILATCDDDGQLSLFQMDDDKGEEIITFSASLDSLNTIEVHEEDLWSGGDDGFLRKWMGFTKFRSAADCVPECNIEVIENCDDVVMINILKVCGRVLYCGLGHREPLVQARNAVTGEIIGAIRSSDWCRAICPTATRTYTAYDDGSILFWENSDDDSAPFPSPSSLSSDHPADAIMDLTLVGSVLVSTSDEALRFISC